MKKREISVTYDGRFSTLSDFKIGAIRNYSYGPKFDGARFDELFRLETEEALIRSLMNRRTDIIIGNDIVIRSLAKKMGIDHRIQRLPPIVSKEPLYIGFSKARHLKKLSENFNKALGQLKQLSGVIKIMQQYN